MLRFRKFFPLVLSIAVLLVLSAPILAQDIPAYLNPDLPVEERVADLLARMSLEEKIGQMTQIEKNSLTPADVTEWFIGSVLSGGGGYPFPNTPEAWAAMVDSFQEAALATPLAIPMIYGVDAVHGHNNVEGAVIFPQNVGLGATRNAELVEETARITAREMIATGIYWNFAPVIAVPQDIRWGRAYEGFGENTDLVTELGTAYLRGLQGESLSDPGSVLGTPKHFIGDGGAAWGTSPFGPQNIDRGETMVDEARLRELYLPPYIAAIENGAQSIMISFSSWDGLPMHAQSYLINDVLKGELGFTGFTISDWAGIDTIGTDYYAAVVTAINAGVDMNMVPYDFEQFINVMLEAVENGDITIERIDDAVSRILRVKFELGLFEHPFSDPSLIPTVGADEHRAVAREAVSQSLVLLKNENEALPILAEAQTIFVAGTAADDIGLQSGGWSIEWQGRAGNITEGTTILEALEAAVSEGTDVRYNRFGRFENFTDDAGNPLIADIGIVVISEPPYAEYEGDSASLELAESEWSTVERLRPLVEKLVVVVLSGRPMIINDAIVSADAVVAAWLPGTEGAGVADVLLGDLPFVGKLPYTWPRSVDQLPFDFANLASEGCDAPLFPYDYGLTYENSESSWVDLAIECSGGEAVAAAPAEADAIETAASSSFLAPEGVSGETYYAPFPVSIALDGDLADWAGVPRVVLAGASETPTVSFAAAADGDNLYFSADVTDDSIITGQHGTDYWNEDSVEFYLNATGDLNLSEYIAGVAQITIPALNANQPEEPAIGGMQGASADAQVSVVLTDTGYRVEAAVPLVNDVWEIVPEHDGILGFQVHLNSASSADRDTKLIWSVFDSSDQSYLDPGLFGQLIFFEVGEAAALENGESSETVVAEDNITWDSREWVLVWSDEFDGEAGTPVNSEYWTHDVGGHGWGNNQLEYDTNDPENASLDGSGNLAIVAREGSPEGRFCHYGNCDYTSARLITRNNVEFTYGRVEARIQIPRGQGIWPAFWMLGSNFQRVGWPASGEIDIMENVGKEPQNVYGTVHGPGYSGGDGVGGSYSMGEDFADDFHVYAVDWDPDAIRWYVDGELVNTITPDDLRGNQWVFDHDFFIILNVAVGGYWPGNPDETTEFPQTMLVDYVRVYQLAE